MKLVQQEVTKLASGSVQAVEEREAKDEIAEEQGIWTNRGNGFNPAGGG